MAPGGRIAFGVGLDRQGVMGQRAILAAAHVVLTRPHQLDGPTDQRAGLGRRGARDLDAFHHIVARRRAAPAERAPGVERLDLDGLGRDAHGLAHGRRVPALGLTAVGELHLGAVQHRRAIHRLHGGVGQVGEVVGGLEQIAVEGALRFAVVVERNAGERALARGHGLEVGQDLLGAPHLGVGIVPDHLQGVPALSGGIGRVGQHGHAGRDLHHLDHALDLARRGVVETGDLAAKARRVGDHRHQHPLAVDVLGIADLAPGLGPGVLAPGALSADQGEALGVLQRGLLGRGDLGGVRQQGAEAGRLTRGVADHAVLHRHFGRRNAPPGGGGLHEHGPGRGARRAHLCIGAGDGAGAAGALCAQQAVGVELVVGRGVLDGHLGPVGVHLLADQGGDADVVALTHFQELVDHRDRAVRRDLDELAEGSDRRRLGQRLHRSDDQRAADHGRTDQDAAAVQFGGLEGSVHGDPP